MASRHEAVDRSETHPLVYGFKGKSLSTGIMINRHMVDLSAVKSRSHVSYVVAAFSHTEEQVALGKSAGGYSLVSLCPQTYRKTHDRCGDNYLLHRLECYFYFRI